MNPVSVEFLSLIARDGCFYALLGETAGMMRQTLLEVDPFIGIGMEYHIDIAPAGDRFKVGVGHVLLQRGEKQELEGEITFLLEGKVITERLNLSYALRVGLGEKCPYRMDEQLFKEISLKPGELEEKLPGLEDQEDHENLHPRGKKISPEFRKVLRYMEQLDKRTGEDRKVLLERLLWSDLVTLMKVYTHRELFETAAEIREVIRNLFAAIETDLDSRFLESAFNY